MPTYLTALVLTGLVFAASVISIELGFAAAIIEIALGTIAGNFLGVQTTPGIDFLAAFGSILLTFLAGTEVNKRIMRKTLKESLLSFAKTIACGWLCHRHAILFLQRRIECWVRRDLREPGSPDRVPGSKNGQQIYRRVPARSILPREAWTLYNLAHEHGLDVRDHLVAVRFAGGHYQSSAVLSARHDRDSLGDCADLCRATLVCAIHRRGR